MWKPTPPSTNKPPNRPAALQILTKQKSNSNVLHKRKKSLEHRLLISREVMKLQNEQMIGDVGSLSAMKSISFSEASRRIAIDRRTIKPFQPSDFHAIVDQYGWRPEGALSCEESVSWSKLFVPQIGGSGDFWGPNISAAPQQNANLRRRLVNAPVEFERC